MRSGGSAIHQGKPSKWKLVHAAKQMAEAAWLALPLAYS